MASLLDEKYAELVGLPINDHYNVDIRILQTNTHVANRCLDDRAVAEVETNTYWNNLFSNIHVDGNIEQIYSEGFVARLARERIGADWVSIDRAQGWEGQHSVAYIGLLGGNSYQAISYMIIFTPK